MNSSADAIERSQGFQCLGICRTIHGDVIGQSSGDETDHFSGEFLRCLRSRKIAYQLLLLVGLCVLT
jgi:hypothetical protein